MRAEDGSLVCRPTHPSLGSWRKRSGDEPSDDPAHWYSYDELAEILPTYLVELGAKTDVVYAFLRRDAAGSCVMCALNLSDEAAERTFRVEGATSAAVLIDTDWERYGGSTRDAEGEPLACEDGAITLEMPACSGKLVVVGYRPRHPEGATGQSGQTPPEPVVLL